MTLAQRDGVHRICGDYPGWAGHGRFEPIEGMTKLMAAAPTVSGRESADDMIPQATNTLVGSHRRVLMAAVDVDPAEAGSAGEAADSVAQRAVPAPCDPARIRERGARECRMAYPTGRMRASHRAANCTDGKPIIALPMRTTPVAVLPDMAMAWD